jgi:hypothetical protein
MHAGLIVMLGLLAGLADGDRFVAGSKLVP